LSKHPAVLFDLDGTLIDSRLTIAAACNHALAWAGREPLATDIVAGFVGDGARMLIARALGLDARQEEVGRVLGEFLQFYAANPILGTTWMPGALEALDALSEHPLAIVTNKARVATEPVLEALGIRARFATIVAGGDAPNKPDPAPVAMAIRALGADVAGAWVVGDGVQDVLAGRAAGCRTVAVLGGFASEAQLRAAGPDVVLSSLVELAAVVLQ
jgi:phosphoglycolate phosphatase